MNINDHTRCERQKSNFSYYVGCMSLKKKKKTQLRTIQRMTKYKA